MNGLWHKIGARGLPFVFINGEWIRSNKPASEIIRQTKRRPNGTFTE